MDERLILTDLDLTDWDGNGMRCWAHERKGRGRSICDISIVRGEGVGMQICNVTVEIHSTPSDLRRRDSWNFYLTNTVCLYEAYHSRS